MTTQKLTRHGYWPSTLPWDELSFEIIGWKLQKIEMVWLTTHLALGGIISWVSSRSASLTPRPLIAIQFLLLLDYLEISQHFTKIVGDWLTFYQNSWRLVLKSNLPGDISLLTSLLHYHRYSLSLSETQSHQSKSDCLPFAFNAPSFRRCLQSKIFFLGNLTNTG